jgi:hypothetical protein
VQETWIVASGNPLKARTRLLGGIGLLALVAMLGCEEPLHVPRRVLKGPDGGAAAVELAANGDSCTADDECASGHCDNAICCPDGNCCHRSRDCPATDGMMAVCNDEPACQGKRGVVECSKQFQCEARDDSDDDSACTEEIEALRCDPFLPVHCTGERDQDVPECPTECEEDSECVEEAHCFEGSCVPDVVAAASCVNDGDCVTGHCSNNICCASGTCCTDVSECQAPEFSLPPTCDEASSCQGTRGVPACENSQCSVKHIQDDSGCNATVVARDCGEAADVLCSGERSQGTNGIPCASGRCSQNYECARTAYCRMGMCTPDVPNGESCSSPDMCQSGHCEDDICCSHDCCPGVENRCPDVEVCPEKKEC